MLKGLPELGVLLQVERELPHLIRQVYVGKGSGLFAEQEQANWQQAEARLRAKEFGLTPSSLLTLKAEVERVEEAEDKGRRRKSTTERTAPKSRPGDDPRAALSVVS